MQTRSKTPRMIVSSQLSLPCLPTELVLQIVLESLSDTITFQRKYCGETELFQSHNSFFLGLPYSYRSVMLSCSWLKSELMQRWHSCDQFLYVGSESLGHSASRTDIRLTETLRQRLCMDTASPLNLFVGFEPLVPKSICHHHLRTAHTAGKRTTSVTDCI